MLPIRNILVPVNFTAACQAAANFAHDLAGSLNAEICLLHVIEPAASATGLETAAVFEASMRGLREHATRTLDAFLEQADASVQRCVLEGDPATEIVRFAHNERVDLILMPTHGYGVFRRLLLGSVTAKVLHDADCPVWTGLHPERCDSAGRDFDPKDSVRGGSRSSDKCRPSMGRAFCPALECSARHHSRHRTGPGRLMA